jgi:hypothetical protein
MLQKNDMVYALAETPRPQSESNDKQTIDKVIDALAFLYLPSSQGVINVLLDCSFLLIKLGHYSTNFWYISIY